MVSWHKIGCFELASSNALLTAALQELRGSGMSNAVADALVSVSVTDAELAEFLDLAAQESQGHALFGLALSRPQYLNRRGVGFEALDQCLSRLGDKDLRHVGMRMSRMTSPTVLDWWHSRLTSVVRNDGSYGDFLEHNLNTVLTRHLDAMTAYLLYPNRGPGRRNIDSFAAVIPRVDNPQPFQQRWVEWIIDGYFDPPRRQGFESAEVLYWYLNRH